MVARTPSKQSRIAAPLNPVLIRETLKKVDKCMARLQELQCTMTGGRGYMRTSLRCKQESLRGMAENVITSYDSGETVGEILQSSQFAREIVAPVACKTNKTAIEDPKTPLTQLRKQRPNSENTQDKSVWIVGYPVA